MVAGVNTLTTILNASSPFIVTGSSQTVAPSKTESTLLTPRKDSAKTADIANIFSPAADIASLTPQTASVLLTEQAREKPLILQNPNPPLENTSLGNLDIYKELLTTPLVPDNSNATENKNSYVKDTLEKDSFGNTPQTKPDINTPDTSGQNSFDFTAPKQDTANAPQQVFADKPTFTSAIASYQQASPALTGGASAASVNITA